VVVQVIVNLFKAGDTAARELQGIWYQRKMFTNMLRKHGVPSAPARGSGGVQKQRSCTDNLFVLTRILQEAGKANKTVYAFFLDVRKAYDVWRMAVRQVARERCGESYGGSCET
jgi:hypothetical protein